MKPAPNYLLVGLSLALAIALLVILVLAVFIYPTHRASNRLLQAFHQIEPGMPISTVRERLGEEMQSWEAQESPERSINSPDFLKDKKIYWFHYSAPPARVIEVYTDQNDRVVYTTWHGL